MAYIDNRPTSPPPPNNPLFIVQLFYPNNKPLAKQVSRYLKNHVQSEHDMLQTIEQEILVSGVHNVHAHLIIVGVDEFCDLTEVFCGVHRYFNEKAPIIAHLAAPIAMDESTLMDCSVIGSFIQYDFKTLTSLVEAAIKNNLIPLTNEILIETD